MFSYSWPVYACPLARSRMSPAAERMAPPGRSMDHWRTTCATPSKVRPYCRNVASGISMEISNGRAPATCANETFGNATISSRMVSASSFMAASSKLPATCTFTTWMSNPASESCGRSVSAGNVEMPSTASLSLSIISARTTSSTSSTVTVPPPSDAVERISLMPSMGSTASSSRSNTPFSTSSGAAPRYGTWIWMRLDRNSGKLSFLTM